MEESLSVSVTWRDREYSFEARVQSTGYTHQFMVTINGVEVVFEPDEERNYRAIINTADQAKLKDADIEMIGLVAEKLQAVRDGIIN